MQAKGQDILAVIELGRYPGIALAVKKDRADKIKTIADLKGAKIGVTAPGSSTNMIVWYLMAKAGLKPDDASFIGVGAAASAIVAIQRGEIDAISNVDPVISKLQSTNEVVVLAETRTTEGTTKVLGGPMSAAVLYLKRDFMDKNPNTVQALVNAFYKTLEVAGQSHARAGCRQGPAGILAGRQGALHGRREEQPAGLFPRWGRQRREPEALARLPQAVRQGDRRRHHRPRQDLGRQVREEGRRNDQVASLGVRPLAIAVCVYALNVEREGC